MKTKLLAALFILMSFGAVDAKNCSCIKIGGEWKLPDGSPCPNIIQTAVPFLRIAPDARSTGMGDMGVATSADDAAIHYNPAKLAFIKEDIGFQMTYTPWLKALNLNDVFLAQLAGHKKLGDDQAIGLELKYFSLGTIDYIDENRVPQGQGKPNELSLAVAYSRKLSKHFGVGITGKFIYSNLAAGQIVRGIQITAGTSGAADIGVFYERDIKAFNMPSHIRVGAAITFNEFFSNKIIREYFPQIGSYSTLVASEQIRNMATVGGNIVNASPIGDLSIIFLALNASLSIINFGDEERSVLLEKFYLGYKTIDLKKSELIYYIYLDIPHKETKFNFEKVSKRTKLDIASVNSAMSIRLEKNLIEEIHFSLGGVAPIPLYISSFASILNGKELNLKLIKSALDEIGKSINPIDDIRGSGNYKKFLAYQLFMQHLMKLFPSSLEDTEILNLMNEKSRVL